MLRGDISQLDTILSKLLIKVKALIFWETCGKVHGINRRMKASEVR